MKKIVSCVCTCATCQMRVKKIGLFLCQCKHNFRDKRTMQWAHSVLYCSPTFNKLFSLAYTSKNLIKSTQGLPEVTRVIARNLCNHKVHVKLSVAQQRKDRQWVRVSNCFEGWCLWLLAMFRTGFLKSFLRPRTPKYNDSLAKEPFLKHLHAEPWRSLYLVIKIIHSIYSTCCLNYLL